MKLVGEQMEDAVIRNPLNLSTADALSTAIWWSAAVTYASGFDIEKR